jgi:hypothetical protein
MFLAVFALGWRWVEGSLANRFETCSRIELTAGPIYETSQKMASEFVWFGGAGPETFTSSTGCTARTAGPWQAYATTTGSRPASPLAGSGWG